MDAVHNIGGTPWFVGVVRKSVRLSESFSRNKGVVISLEFSGSTEGFVKDIVDFFIVGRGINRESLLGGHSARCLAVVSDPLLECTFWEAFPV